MELDQIELVIMVDDIYSEIRGLLLCRVPAHSLVLCFSAIISWQIRLRSAQIGNLLFFVWGTRLRRTVLLYYLRRVIIIFLLLPDAPYYLSYFFFDFVTLFLRHFFDETKNLKHIIQSLLVCP